MFIGVLMFLRQDVLTFNLLLRHCSNYLAICIKSYYKENFPMPQEAHLFHRQPRKIRKVQAKYLTKAISRQYKFSLCDLSSLLHRFNRLRDMMKLRKNHNGKNSICFPWPGYSKKLSLYLVHKISVLCVVELQIQKNSQSNKEAKICNI